RFYRRLDMTQKFALFTKESDHSIGAERLHQPLNPNPKKLLRIRRGSTPGRCAQNSTLKDESVPGWKGLRMGRTTGRLDRIAVSRDAFPENQSGRLARPK